MTDMDFPLVSVEELTRAQENMEDKERWTSLFFLRAQESKDEPIEVQARWCDQVLAAYRMRFPRMTTPGPVKFMPTPTQQSAGVQ